MVSKQHMIPNEAMKLVYPLENDSFDDLPSMSTAILHGKHLSSIPFSRCQWWYKPCEIPLIDD
jgi:hypothetical protein